MDFRASFEWEACNNQPYDMTIFRSASNVKIAVERNGETINDRIDRVQSVLNQGACQEFGPRIKNVNTCADEKLFYSINVQGSNRKGKFWFECQEFTFKNLKFGTQAPTVSPTVSVQPSHKPSSACGYGKSGNCPPSKGKGGKGGKGANNASVRRNRRATRRNSQKK